MMPTNYELLRWIHILCMMGLLGGLLVFQLGLSTSARMDAANLRGAVRVWNILLGAGLLAAILMYGLARGHTLGGHYNGVIGLKLVILLAVGALLPKTQRSEKGDRMRWLCILMLLIASFAAFTI
jgi:hypothetical protein